MRFRWTPEQRRSVAGQVALVLAAWIFVAVLHWSNDGLWYQGDSARHMANGEFWRALIRDLPRDPLQYALQYYARYPVTQLTSYPPVFYLLEAVAFSAFGPSPYVTKFLVLCFALTAALYAVAWLRRWVQPEAGWAGALTLLAPGSVMWSHAAMLNVPAYALVVAALYHAKRWLEVSRPEPSHHGAAAAALSIAAVLVYYPAGVVFLIIPAWILLHRWRALYSPRVLIAAAVTAVVLVPCAIVVVRWAPRVIQWLNPNDILNRDRWLFYPTYVTDLLSPPLVVFAILGILVGLGARRWRNEAAMLCVWVAITYVVFSCIEIQESRYVLPIVAAAVYLCAIAVCWIGSWFDESLSIPHVTGRRVVLGGVSVLVGLQVALAYRQTLPSVSGFSQVASFLATVAPRETVLFDGYHDGVFMYYMLAGDPDLQRGVVLARKVLDADGNNPVVNPRRRAEAVRIVRETLRTRTGCRWVALEDPAGSPPGIKSTDGHALSQYLREAVNSPEIEHVKSFSVTVPAPRWIHLYRWREPVQPAERLDLAFPDLGDGIRLDVTPIAPRTGRKLITP